MRILGRWTAMRVHSPPRCVELRKTALSHGRHLGAVSFVLYSEVLVCPKCALMRKRRRISVLLHAAYATRATAFERSPIHYIHTREAVCPKWTNAFARFRLQSSWLKIYDNLHFPYAQTHGSQTAESLQSCWKRVWSTMYTVRPLQPRIGHGLSRKSFSASEFLVNQTRAHAFFVAYILTLHQPAGLAGMVYPQRRDQFTFAKSACV